MYVFKNLRITGLRAAVAAVGLSILSVPAWATGTSTPIAAVTTAIDFTDLTTDLTALMVALLGLFLTLIAFKLGINWLRKLARG